MDQKLQGLDPKLQDAYKRVMGTPTPTPASPSHADHNPTLVAIDTKPKKNGSSGPSGISPILLWTMVIIFFAVYTLACMLYFKIPIPGLSL